MPYSTYFLHAVFHLFVVDLEIAKWKIATFYKKEFSDIRFFSQTSDSYKVPLHRVYVPMTWKKCEFDIHKEEERDLHSIEELFNIVRGKFAHKISEKHTASASSFFNAYFIFVCF